jgi:hypothetical protein
LILKLIQSRNLGANLNMVCNFKMKKSKSTIHKLGINKKIAADHKEICVIFNQCFVNAGDKLVKDLLSQYPWSAKSNDCDRYLGKPVVHSIFCEPDTAHLSESCLHQFSHCAQIIILCQFHSAFRLIPVSPIPELTVI